MDDKGSEGVALPGSEVPMIEPDSVRQLRQLAERGWGAKRIARELGLARNTVRRYLRGGEDAERQQRPGARRLDEAGHRALLELFDGDAEGNAVVAADLLRARGYRIAARTVQ